MVARSLIFVISAALVMTACASKRPVFYPNDAYRELGEGSVHEITEYCLERAREAEVAQSRKAGAAKGGTVGAVFGSIIGGAIGWIFGNPGRGAAAGAVHGGGTGAAKGASQSGDSDTTFQAYAEACLREHGLEPVGWK
jgi:outer membrane lipoprotein SlyB